MISVIPATARIGARISISRRVAERAPEADERDEREQPARDHEPRAAEERVARPFTSPIQSIALCPVSGISPSTPLEIMSAIPPIKQSAESTPQTPEHVVRLDRFKAARSCGPRAPDASSRKAGERAADPLTTGRP